MKSPSVKYQMISKYSEMIAFKKYSVVHLGRYYKDAL